MTYSQIALKAGREFLRKETGFVHYYYHGNPKETHPTIPLYENFAWSLALFQTRTQEGVSEGKETLSSLLEFQNSDGEFPVYLHEYPKAKDHFLGAYLFYPLYWILKDYGAVLGPDLRFKCAECLKKLTAALKRRFDEKKPEGHIRIKIAGVLYAMENDMAPVAPFQELPFSSGHIADIEFARDLGAPGLPEWPAVFWHEGLQCYTGPAYKELQEGLEPEVTLLDLMMGSKREKKLTPHHISASLIRSSPIPSGLTVRGVKQDPLFAYAALEKTESKPLYHQPGFHLFRFICRGSERLDSLAFQGGRVEKALFEERDDEVIFKLDLSPDFDPDSRDKQREIELFVNLGPKIKGSVFRLDEPVEIAFQSVKLKITFRLMQGVGDFIGHISRGNRPAQIVQGEAFDQVLSLRTLRRSPDARIEMKIQIIR